MGIWAGAVGELEPELTALGGHRQGRRMALDAGDREKVGCYFQSGWPRN